MPEWLSVALSLLALAGAAWSVTRTAPARLLRTVAECAEQTAAIEAAWRTERAQLIAWLEEAQGVLDSVERKRRQVSGAASRLAAGNGSTEPDPVANPEAYREHFMRMARSRGLL